MEYGDLATYGMGEATQSPDSDGGQNFIRAENCVSFEGSRIRPMIIKKVTTLSVDPVRKIPILVKEGQSIDE